MFIFEMRHDHAFSALQAESMAGRLFSERNNPIRVSRMPRAAIQVIFSWRISTEVTVVMTGTR